MVLRNTRRGVRAMACWLKSGSCVPVTFTVVTPAGTASARPGSRCTGPAPAAAPTPVAADCSCSARRTARNKKMMADAGIDAASVQGTGAVIPSPRAT